MKEYRIHPAIGIARLGNADRGDDENDGWFIGPETPGLPPNYDPAEGEFRPFKKDGKVKAQAARFRVWEYEEQNGQLVPVREVNLDSPGIVRIEWTVELANRKAAFFNFNGQVGAPDFSMLLADEEHLRNFGVPMDEREAKLTIVPGARDIEGRRAAAQEFLNTKPHIPVDTLGEIRTDETGRLLVFGGYGESGFLADTSGDLPHYANNDGWFDDTSDGPVKARITVREANGTEHTEDAVHGAWVLVGPPDFAPPIGNVVTLYDTFTDIAVREPRVSLPANHALYTEYAPGRGLASLRAMRAAWQSPQGIAGYQPSFTREIYPIFERGFQTRWVHQPLNEANPNGTVRHRLIAPTAWAELGKLPGSEQRRRGVFTWMRSSEEPRNPNKMPLARGDTPYSSDNGDDLFLRVTDLQFALLSNWRNGRFVADWFGEPPIPAAPEISPEGLDRAALESSVGGAFYPGIEAGWLARHPQVFVEPFRVRQDAVLSQTVIGELKIRAGFFSQQMAVPWQADFLDCQKEQGNGVFYAWWPGQRPDEVFMENGGSGMVAWARGLADHQAMVDRWHTRGFVVRHGGRYVEREGPP